MPVQMADVVPAWQLPQSCPLQRFFPFFPVQTPEQHSLARLHRLPTSLQPGPATTASLPSVIEIDPGEQSERGAAGRRRRHSAGEPVEVSCIHGRSPGRVCAVTMPALLDRRQSRLAPGQTPARSLMALPCYRVGAGARRPRRTFGHLNAGRARTQGRLAVRIARAGRAGEIAEAAAVPGVAGGRLTGAWIPDAGRTRHKHTTAAGLGEITATPRAVMPAATPLPLRSVTDAGTALAVVLAWFTDAHAAKVVALWLRTRPLPRFAIGGCHGQVRAGKRQTAAGEAAQHRAAGRSTGHRSRHNIEGTVIHSLTSRQRHISSRHMGTVAALTHAS